MGHLAFCVCFFKHFYCVVVVAVVVVWCFLLLLMMLCVGVRAVVVAGGVAFADVAFDDFGFAEDV